MRSSGSTDNAENAKLKDSDGEYEDTKDSPPGRCTEQSYRVPSSGDVHVVFGPCRAFTISWPVAWSMELKTGEAGFSIASF